MNMQHLVFRLVFLVIVLISCRAFQGNQTFRNKLGVSETANIVREIINYYHSDCVVLHTVGSFQEESFAKEVTNYLSINYLPAATIHVNMSFDDVSKRSHDACNRLLYVILFFTWDVHASLVQIADAAYLSRAKWLIFLEDDANLDEIFLNIHIPFDCDFLLAQSVKEEVRITEVYRVAEKLPLQKNVLGLWTPTRGFPRPELNYNKRRGSLQGVVLRSSFYHAPPRVVLKTVGNKVGLRGFCGEVWSILEEKMNFTSDHHASLVRSGGHRVKKVWVGVTGEAERREIDVSAMTIAMTSDKMKVVDFSHPLFLMPYLIYIRKPEGTLVHWYDFLSPFSSSLWLSFIASSVFTACVMTFAFRVLQHFGAAEQNYYIFDSLFLVFGASFCQQGQDRVPRTLSCRIVFMVVYLVGVIAINSYSASLISNLTVSTPLMPFKSIHELRADDSYSVGIIANGTMHQMFQSTKVKSFKDLYRNKILVDPKNLPANYVEAFERLCSQQFALIAQNEIIYTNRPPCPVTSLPQGLITLSASFIFPKNSPYKHLFNYYILSLMESGVMTRMYLDVIMSSRIEAESAVQYKSIGIQEVTPFLLIMGAGVTFGILNLAWERWGRYLQSCWMRQQAARSRRAKGRKVRCDSREKGNAAVLPNIHTTSRGHKPGFIQYLRNLNPAAWQPRHRNANHVIREAWQGPGLFTHTEYVH